MQQILDELIPMLRAIDAQSSAAVEFLKAKGMTTHDEFGQYLQQASDASDVRWLAARLRLERLFSTAESEAKETVEEDAEKAVNEREAKAREEEKKPAQEDAEANAEPQDKGSEEEAA
jgi:hypothetical protein